MTQPETTLLLKHYCAKARLPFSQIETDPIELWAAPGSRSRVEKDFYDQVFRPFYRTEQIIIHAKNLDSVRSLSP